MTSAHPDGDIRIFHKECVSLAQAGFEVHLVLCNSVDHVEMGVQVHSVKYRSSSRFNRMLNASKAVYKQALALDADIYHFHDPELLPYGLKLAKKGKKVIYDAHEDVPLQILGKYWIPAIFRKCVSWAFERYENFVAKRLAFVVVSTPTIKLRFEQVNRNCEAICNYPILGENIQEVSWSAREKAICYVGGLSPIRGITEIVESMAYLEDVQLHLAGGFSPESYREELTKLPTWDKVILHGYLDRVGVIEVINRSKIGLVTLYPQKNYLDSLPIKMFEYMYSGIPVIASNFPLWEEIVSATNSGICIDPKNPKEIAAAVDKILSDEMSAQEMGRNGRKAVLEKYNWKIEEQKLVAIYKNLADVK